MDRIKKMIKTWIVKLFKIETHARDFMDLSMKYEDLESRYELRGDVLNSYVDELDILKAKIEKLEEMYADPMATINKLTDEIDRVAHKSYAQGRQDAYAEMGIKALDARVNGNVICVDETGKFVEVITTPTLEEVCEEAGIDINDVVDVYNGIGEYVGAMEVNNV